jgi:pyruvate kinase
LFSLAGQEVVVHAVGAEYTTWEGYLEEGTGRAVIGLSYDNLCRDVQPGGRILLADGSITIKVGGAHALGCINTCVETVVEEAESCLCNSRGSHGHFYG